MRAGLWVGSAVALVLAYERWGVMGFARNQAAAAVAAVLPGNEAAAKFAPVVAESAAAAGVPWYVAVAVAWQESSFRPEVVSDLGAVGLMQITPIALAEVHREGFAHDVDLNGLIDARNNARVGCRLLAHLFGRYGSWREALAHYFWGEHVKTYTYADQVLTKAAALKGWAVG